LTRFATAKDDNEKKTLGWSVVTDADGVMRITLRDFRPHVDSLKKLGLKEMAEKLAQDYLDKYVTGLNEYAGQLARITSKSRETKGGNN
jgi:hypothetical protein